MTNSEEAARLEANKQLVLDMWYHFICAHDVTKAAQYIAEDYVQHNPNAEQGLKGVVDYHVALWPEGPKAPGTYQMTQFAAVLAEGDLVQLVMRIPRPHPTDPARTYDSHWFDLFRVKDGMIVEHWDSAVVG